MILGDKWCLCECLSSFVDVKSFVQTNADNTKLHYSRNSVITTSLSIILFSVFNRGNWPKSYLWP